jgi:penicillin amidase
MRASQLRVRRGSRGRRIARVVNLVAALGVSVVLLAVLGFGYGTIPALGPALDPGRGAWTSAAGGAPVRTQTLAVAGLQHPVTVGFTAQGVPAIRAASDRDMFLALGYLHARFRLSEMDEERRLGEGRLAQSTRTAPGSRSRSASPAWMRTCRRGRSAIPPIPRSRCPRVSPGRHRR